MLFNIQLLYHYNFAVLQKFMECVDNQTEDIATAHTPGLTCFNRMMNVHMNDYMDI